MIHFLIAENNLDKNAEALFAKGKKTLSANTSQPYKNENSCI